MSDLGKLHTCTKCGFTAGVPIVTAAAACTNPHACARRRRRNNKEAQAERIARLKAKLDGTRSAATCGATTNAVGSKECRHG